MSGTSQELSRYHCMGMRCFEFESVLGILSIYKDILTCRRAQCECTSLRDEIALYKETVTAKDQIVVDLTNQVQTETRFKILH